MFFSDGAFLSEDFTASKHSKYTIEGVDKNSANWLEKAAEKVHAAKKDDYVRLESGLLTVNQIEYLLDAMKADFNFVDDNNEFLAYNHPNTVKSTMTDRTPIPDW